jgi:hypothetical protein
MTAAFVFETAAWSEAAKMLEPFSSLPKPPGAAAHPAGCGIPQDMTQTQVIFVQGLAAAEQKSPAFPKILTSFKAHVKAFTGPARQKKMLAIQELELAGASAATKGRLDDAVKAMRQAVTLEAQITAPSGPPELVKPPSELFGEILLAAHRPAAAEQQFRSALTRHPNRTLSRLGAEQARKVQDSGT